MESELRKRKFFDLAKKLSLKSEYHHKLGAVVVNKRGKILGVGFNKPNKTHPKARTPFKTVHCEFDAIIGIPKEDLVGATIFIYRQHANGTPASSKPCPACENLIRIAGIKKVCHTGNNSYEEYENYV